MVVDIEVDVQSETAWEMIAGAGCLDLPRTLDMSILLLAKEFFDFFVCQVS